jgi:hypothetical protein
VKKTFSVFCVLLDREMKTLSKRFTQEQLENFLSSKLDAVIAKECEQIEQDEEFEKGEIA